MSFWAFHEQIRLFICTLTIVSFQRNQSVKLISFLHVHVNNYKKNSLQSEEGIYAGMYSGIDLTTYDSDVHSAEVNETVDDDWDADIDPLYLVGQVFETVFFSIDRYSNTENEQ